VHPDFIHLGPLDIHTYGVLVACGFMVGLWVAARRAAREGFKPEQVTDLGVWLILSGMLGGKLFHIIFFWDEFIAAWRAEGLRSLREGFVFYGGFILASLTAVVYARLKRLPLAKLVDVFAPSVALGHAFGRLGCFFNGCCYGKVCSPHFLFGVRFPAFRDGTGRVIGSLPFMDQLQRGWVNISAHASLPVYPTQLCEAVGNLIIFAGLTVYYSRKRFDGQIWWLYVLSYGALRFVVEFFRGDYETYYFGVLTIAQVIAAVLIVVATIMLARRPTRRSPTREPAGAARANG
jgi:phosphatidylglycerol:prolipoprotein diacylglycerol transferase